ncbi:MAS protein, partial [Nycticryphes semicollaris]|nr:MAS protein [Nycticryphes semicollaris]
DSNTTDFSLVYSSFEYEDSLPVTEYWCISCNYTALIIPGFFIVICLCGLVGNMMVVWFLGFHMKKNPFTVYVLNLAIADFSLLLVILAIRTLFIISTLYYIDLPEYEFSYFFLMYLFLFWYLASMYLLTAMSIERCASVL